AKTSFRSTNALIAFFCSSFKMNALSMSSKTSLSTHISALQRQPCLLKTISTQVTWLITLRLIICPSSYKARPDNLIGLSISSQIFVRRSFLPNGATPDRTSLPQHLSACLSSSGIQTKCSRESISILDECPPPQSVG